MRKVLNPRDGFTLVELVAVLALLAILAALVGTNVVSYVRLARFQHNESCAKTIYQVAQRALTDLETSGGLAAFCAELTTVGVTGDFYRCDESGVSVQQQTSAAALQQQYNGQIYALYCDKNNPNSAASQQVRALLEDYIYDKTLLDASLCLEIDAVSGVVFSVFYDAKAPALRFGAAPGELELLDRSYAHRRSGSLVGYYSMDDIVNAVTLQQAMLEIVSLSLTNAETLAVSWSGNSRHQDTDVSYVATVRDKTGARRFAVTVDLAALQKAGYTPSVASALLPVTVYSADGNVDARRSGDYRFPLRYVDGSFTLTLDAMLSAQILQECAANDALARQYLYSITRFIPEPTDIYVQLQALPNAQGDAAYTAGNPRDTQNTPCNTLMANGAGLNENGGYTGAIACFRHLYNLRWLNPAAAGSFSFAAPNGVLDWTGSASVVYQLYNGSGALRVLAGRPGNGEEVAFPTIPVLGAKWVLSGGGTTIANLQLRTGSVPADPGSALASGAYTAYAAYVGLFGKNYGAITDLNLRDADVVVNLLEFCRANAPENAADHTALLAKAVADASQGRLQTAADYGAAVNAVAPLSALRGVGALCGLNAGTVRNVRLTQSGGKRARVAAALPFGNALAGAQRETADAQTCAGIAVATLRGVGGLIGINRPALGAESAASYAVSGLSVVGSVTGLLLDRDTAAHPMPTSAEARYAAASASAAKTVYRAIGIGGVVGMAVAQNGMAAGDDLQLTNGAVVTGNAFAGGVFGNLLLNGAHTLTLSGLTNTGHVAASVRYKAKASAVLGQFFGGIAGYDRGVGLRGAQSSAAALSADAVRADLAAGGALFYGDFVGGVAGFVDASNLTGCAANSGFVLGHDFVGGLAGGAASATLAAGDNRANVLGHRYVGGLAAVNGAGGVLRGCANHALVAGVGGSETDPAAWVGGIAGYNAGYINACTAHLAANAETVEAFLQGIGAAGADNVGGIAGGNGKDGVVDAGGQAAFVVLQGRDCVGGLVGCNMGGLTGLGAASAVNGRVRGRDCVGGLIGLNRAPILPAASVGVSVVEGRYFVGGVLGANLPAGGFAIAAGGALSTVNAQGRVCAVAVAGGVIGYQQFVSAALGATSPALLLPVLGGDNLLCPTAATDLAAGAVLAHFQNVCTVCASAYVGGILGCQDETSALTLAAGRNEGVIRRTASGTRWDAGVSLNAFLNQNGYAAACRLQEDVAVSFLGGIIGVNPQRTTLQNCTALGGVTGNASALGGIAGINEGVVANCQVQAVLGGDRANLVGGIAGVNAAQAAGRGVIQNCFVTAGEGTQAVRGAAEVGGTAGYNAPGGILENCTVSGGVTATNGAAGGITAHNAGRIDGGGVTGGTIAAAGAALGAVAAVNEGEIVSLTANALSNVRLSGPIAQAGGLVGVNTGRIAGCAVSIPATLFDGLSTGGSLGGLVGENHGSVDNVTVDIMMNDMAKYTVVGGIAGRNSGLMAGCRCTVALGSGNETGVDAVGGIAGDNAGTVQNCAATVVRLAIRGHAENSVAAETSASRMGGVVGYNRAGGRVTGCTVTGPAGGTGMIYAQYGFVGGVAGSNAGAIAQSGDAGAMAAKLVETCNAWLASGSAGRNRMVRVLAGHPGDAAEQALAAAFAALRGSDPVHKAGKGYPCVYNAAQNGNRLLVALKGGTVGEEAKGCLGGIAGRNSASGQITDCATGQWFVYGDNVEESAAVGGVLGWNESGAAAEAGGNSGLVNCAAVRRYHRMAGDSQGDTDGNPPGESAPEPATGPEVPVGGVVGAQQSSAGGWLLSGCINCGAVFGSRANSAGGVVGVWRGAGGTVQASFNFGDLTTNSGGTVGGVVGQINPCAEGAAITLLTCQNHGAILWQTPDAGAEIAAGIVGRVKTAAAGAPVKVTLTDCVNGRAALQGRALACGIFGVLDGGNVENTNVRLDRCRNYSTALGYSAPCGYYDSAAGLCGPRSGGKETTGMTTLTDCFTLSRKAGDAPGGSPLVYQPGGTASTPLYLTGQGNYYMDAEISFCPDYIAGGNTPLADGWGNDGLLGLRRDCTGNETSAGGNPVEELPTQQIGGTRLYAGIDNDALTQDGAGACPYFAAALQNDETVNRINRDNAKITAPNGVFGDPRAQRAITTADGQTVKALLPLLYRDSDGSGAPSLGDVTDEIIQCYYCYILDAVATGETAQSPPPAA